MRRNRTDDADHPLGVVPCPGCGSLVTAPKDPLEIWSRRTLFLTAAVVTVILLIAFGVAFEPLPSSAPFVYSL